MWYKWKIILWLTRRWFGQKSFQWGWWERHGWVDFASSKFKLRMKVEGHVLLETHGTPILCVCVQLLICVWLFVPSWTIAHQAPVPVELSMQEYWGGLPCPPPGIFPSQGLNPCLLCLRHWQVDSFHCGSRGKESACNAGAAVNMGLILSREDPLEKGLETYSSILTWRIPWTEDPDGLHFMGSQESDMTEET